MMTKPMLAFLSGNPLRRSLGVLAAVALLIVLIATLLATHHADDSQTLYAQSSLGQMGAWMAEQGQTDAPESLMGSLAKSTALTADGATDVVRIILLVAQSILAALGAVGLAGLVLRRRWWWRAMLTILIGLDALLFLIPVLPNNPTVPLLLASIALLAAVLLLTPDVVRKFVGVMVIFSLLLMGWEVAKAFGDAHNYALTVPHGKWSYTSYESLDAALLALQNGEANVLVVDNKVVRDLVAEAGADASATQYPDLRVVANFEGSDTFLTLPVRPEFPGRLAVVTRAADAEKWTGASALSGQTVAAVKGDYAETKFLTQPRLWVVLDLRISNDLNMPHLQSIAGALLQPARRQGPVLLVRILANSALYTWGEAVIGFVAGAILGFILGALFAHSRLMERGLLPYVVASQTVPILAIAPMVVIWLGAGPLSVAVISAYLTFFPVTINTLRGLTSPQPTALELMRSYAAHAWTVMWKLRFPAALPYIFTALKVSATSSVVGAVIGELPSGIREGLGGAILNFNQYYTSDPAKLWAAIFIAAVVGIFFYILVALLEFWVLRGKVQEA